jgi:hypothetical protein
MKVKKNHKIQDLITKYERINVKKNQFQKQICQRKRFKSSLVNFTNLPNVI